MDIVQTSAESYPQPNPVRFGDEGELTYLGIVEEVNTDGTVSEATIFFSEGENLRGLTISPEMEFPEPDPANANVDPQAIHTHRLDPEAVLRVLSLSTETLLEISDLATDE